MIKQFCQMGLLFLRSIGLVKAIDYKIGLGKNKIIGLIGTGILIIGYEKNKDIGLVEAINYQTPTDNPRHSTNERTNVKIKRAHVANIKHSTRTHRKNKRENTA